ncbi:MAG: SHOCT domain-containing protein [Candidatus Dormibacteraeota bacterium]|nr:SHOCT domain-containing protein [Candidatus Dormibacteraeota bacterium]
MYGFSMGWGGWLGMGSFLVLLAVGIVVLLMVGFGDSGSRSRARKTLDQRFASGEVSAEEYQSQRRLLG